MPQSEKYGRYSKVIREQVENTRALERVVNNLLAEKEAEIGRLRAERDRYRTALEIIAGQSQDKLHAIQAKAALTNIGADVSADGNS